MDHGACLLQGLHSSTVGHVPHVQLVHPEDHVVHPETHRSRLSPVQPGLRFLLVELDRPQQQLLMEQFSPQPAVLGSCSSRYDLCDEDAGVFTDVRVVCAAGDAESQPRVTLATAIRRQEDRVRPMNGMKGKY